MIYFLKILGTLKNNCFLNKSSLQLIYAIAKSVENIGIVKEFW